ncbi:glycosyltransferase family 4 protein [Muricauda sp. 2012CJ35-5]|uniref:Glycosyltransferase family 4 protein n=1 Tax=Flagellimonas spongiicola TaxID=2942208 RepID=A0ABT0PVY2_9FLAO|nr:glycosyltransferase family 4 protein [Allomuricauda spongiicola]MCL6275538.1 glycosyltransferase family 4 protein [Allomuricauda spongiicola]
MRIAFLGLGIPNLYENSTMYTELMLEFHKDGHEVTLVGPAFEDDVKGLQTEKGVQVLRVPTLNLFQVGKFEKGISNLLLPYQYKKALKNSKIDLKFDLIFMPTPPITLFDLAVWFKKKYKSKIYLILRDIFPQNAVDLKMITQGGIIHRYFREKERKMYRLSDTIGCMSQGNIDYVRAHNPSVSKKKFHLLPNWDTPLPLSQENEIVERKNKMGLNGKFLVVFGGNIGLPQKMENIADLAKSCLEIENLLFLIVGDGYERDPFEDLVIANNLTNVKIMDYMEREEFFKLMEVADVGLISLSEDFTIPNIPSKAVIYHNAKKPILASVDTQTDLPQILEKSGSGVFARAGNTEELKSKLLYLYNNPEVRKTMGNSGYRYMYESLTVDKAYSRAQIALKNLNEKT